MAASDSDPLAKVYYGGQAVIEGVMIRGPEHMAVAVRHPRGHIVTHSEKLGALYTGRSRRIPFLRGVVVLWETMALGMRALNYSSRIAFEEDTEEGEVTEFPEKVFIGTMALALVFVVAIFFAGPILLANLLELVDAHRFVIVGVEGIVRLVLFVGYIWLIGLVPDIRRVFQYHGAEHMTIHAFEAHKPLTVANIRPFPKEHTRCGTSFLLVVVFVALITFFIFDVLVDEGLIIRTASRIVFMPLVAGISYEILRMGARYGGNWFVHAMFVPNIALQGLTTKVPDDGQIEVAIASFEATLAAAGMEHAGYETAEEIEAHQEEHEEIVEALEEDTPARLMERPITILRFASSLDFSGELPTGARAWEVAERILAEASGRTVRTISKPVWPNAKLPGLLNRWLDEFEPDIVLICISSYWVETEVVGNRIRRLGVLVRKLESASQAAAVKPGVADSRAYLLGRRLLLRTIGGRPNFTPAELQANIDSWLRVILRRESVAVGISGTPFSPDTMATKRAQRRATARKDELRSRLGALGKGLGIVVDMPPHAPDAFAPELRLADRVHFNELAHARMGEIDGRALVAVWRGMQGNG